MTLMNSAAQSSATDCPAYSETLLCEYASANHARRLVGTALAAWRLDSLNDAAKLVVTELVANSAQHTRSRQLHVTITRQAADRVRIAVSDGSNAAPVVRHPAETDEHGRGMLIIASLCTATGTDHLGRGKRLWADLVAPVEGQQ